MKITVPDYYFQFRCIASECPATCCAGWQIVIDDRTLMKYRTCRTPFGNRLRNSIDWDARAFYQYDEKCAFLDEQGLCDIYTEAGPEMLCRTCRRYPRHVEEYENEREWSLSLSCPVVARMLLSRCEKIRFLSARRPGPEQQYDSFDLFLYSALQDARSLMFDIMQDRRNGIGFRMAKTLALAHDIQNRIDSRRLFETEALLERYRQPGANEKLKKRLRPYEKTDHVDELRRELSGFMDRLEILDAGWRGKVKEKAALFGQCRREDIPADRGWQELESEQLMVYYLYTYFCGAVYDGDALSKVKMAVVSTWFLRELEYASQIEKRAPLTLEDRARIVWSYSRELEHSDLNLNRMERMMREEKGASFKRLLTLSLTL